MPYKSAILIILFSAFSTALHAQTVTAGDKLMDNGKLNAVIAVVAIILLGIFIFLFFLERKIKKLEDEVKNQV